MYVFGILFPAKIKVLIYHNCALYCLSHPSLLTTTKKSARKGGQIVKK